MNNKPLLIGLTGRKFSGKNTVGEFIKEWAQENGQKAELRGFADSLKLSFARIFVDDATLEESLEFADAMKNYGKLSFDVPLTNGIFDRFGPRSKISGRKALQNYGTEAHREIFGDDFWVDQLLPLGSYDESGNHPLWTDKWGPGNDICIVTDARFPNEAARIKRLGGLVIRIYRPALEKDGDLHASEQDLPRKLVDIDIYNKDTRKKLKSIVFGMMDYAVPEILSCKNGT